MALAGLSHEDGYTLLETLVAMTIFVTVVMVLSSLLGDALLMADVSQQRQALVIAQNEVTALAREKKDVTKERTQTGFKVTAKSEIRGELQIITVSVTNEGSLPVGKAPHVTLHKVLMLK